MDPVCVLEVMLRLIAHAHKSPAADDQFGVRNVRPAGLAAAISETFRFSRLLGWLCSAESGEE